MFLSGFHDAYQQYTPEQLSLENKPDWLSDFLESAFAHEEHDFHQKKQGALFMVARSIPSQRVIGFASYDHHNTSADQRVHIRQLAVDPANQKHGLGKLFVLDTVKQIKNNNPARIYPCDS